MNHESGFYTIDGAPVIIFNLVLFLAVAVLFFANRLRWVRNDFPVQRSSKLCGVLAMLSGVSIVAFVLMDTIYPELEQNLSKTVLMLRQWAAVGLGILAALSLIIVGLSLISGKAGIGGAVVAIFASIWQVYMLISRFNSYTTLTTISDNLLAVMFMAAATLFLVGQARTIYGFTSKDGRNYTLFSGLSTSLFGLLLVVPNYVCMAVDGITMPAVMLGMWESIYVLVLSIYSLALVVNIIRSIKQV